MDQISSRLWWVAEERLQESRQEPLEPADGAHVSQSALLGLLRHNAEASNIYRSVLAVLTGSPEASGSAGRVSSGRSCSPTSDLPLPCLASMFVFTEVWIC